jgi:hypothetical protein
LTVRVNAARLARLSRPLTSCPALRSQACTASPRPPHPALHVRDDRDTPLFGRGGMARANHIFLRNRSEIFFARTGQAKSRWKASRNSICRARDFVTLARRDGRDQRRNGNASDLPVGLSGASHAAVMARARGASSTPRPKPRITIRPTELRLSFAAPTAVPAAAIAGLDAYGDVWTASINLIAH